MLFKQGYADTSVVRKLDNSEVQSSLASPEITSRLEKFANTVRNIAPKSDDFLYFTIIFLKAAESCLIDDFGNQKKVGHEKAWGYFDDNWRWKGNVKPHKNNNGDIFPSIELQKAAKDWIGMPLCVDHKSDSVDGVRGIILDTYYDEKMKQVVGLCALDRINYPDLARKVETGVVRFGSMGTAVSTSICTECGAKASTPQDYCEHIIKRQAWGEINVGLRPIEYSLVVQPAEPAAKLLRCIASIKNHESELNALGVTVESLAQKLSANKVDDLDILLNTVCGKDGCSIDERQRIVKGFLRTNGFMKSASTVPNPNLTKSLAEFQNASGYTLREAPELYASVFGEEFVKQLPLPEENSGIQGETVGGQENAYHSENLVGKSSEDVSDLTGTGSSAMTSSVTEERPETFQGDGVGPEHYAFAEDNKTIKSISEELMKEARRRQRAEQRRRLAFHQGGVEGVEPKTFKDESSKGDKIRENEDKQMLQDKSMGGADGMFPGDESVKTKQLRANERASSTKTAYHQGGATGVEPSTYKSEDYHKYWNEDKHMSQDKSMGGADGMFPGDEKVKETQKRAAYNGPALKTVFKQKRNLNGTINKSASCFEVYAGQKLIIAATAKDIFGKKLEDNWSWITSQEYGKAVVASIRENGVEYVGKFLTKTSQELPAGPSAPPAMPPAADPMGAAPSVPGMGEDMAPMDEDPMAEESGDPKADLEDALTSMETAIEDAKSALTELGGENVDVNINVDKPEDEVQELQLASSILHNLKLVIADASESADELAMLAETYDGYKKLSRQQRVQLKALTKDALNDSASISGESNTLVRMAKVLASTLVKTSQYVEEVPPVKEEPVTESMADDKKEEEDESTAELVTAAMNIRKSRRNALLKKAQEMTEASEEEKEKENSAHDGVGMKENIPVAGVADGTAEQLSASKPTGGEHKPAPSKGNADVKQFPNYPSTPARTVAEKANPADDGKDEPKEVAETNAESEAKDKEIVQAKLTDSFMKKKATEEREAYRLKLRRAYDVAMNMQKKGLLAATKPALDRQVDEIMDFDDKAFEAFKRSIAMAQGSNLLKNASESDLGGVNIGVTSEQHESTVVKTAKLDANSLSKLWDDR